MRKSRCWPIAARRGPYGLNGGEPGKAGRTTATRESGQQDELAGKTSVRLRKGEHIRIESPGGGGWGKAIYAEAQGPD